jgi:dTDP-4-amino-4,6-dideoxygalactose transaminase
MAYAEGLAGSSAVLPTFRADSAPTFREYTIRVQDQQHVYRALRSAGIEAVLHYVPPIHQQPVYDGQLPGADHVPVTDKVVRQIICLPVTVELDKEDISYVVAILRDLL